MTKKRLILRAGLAALIVGQGLIYFNRQEHTKAQAVAPSAHSENFQFEEMLIPGTGRIDELLQKIVVTHKRGGDSAVLFDELEDAYAMLFNNKALSLSRKLRFYKNLNDADLSERLLPDIITAITLGASIDEALQLAERHGIDSSEGNLEEIVATRFEVAPGESLQWLATSSHEGLTRDLLPELISQWAVDDIKASADFLEQLPNHHKAKDLALGLFIHTVVRKDQNRARDLLAQVQDEDYRQYLSEEIETFIEQ